MPDEYRELDVVSLLFNEEAIIEYLICVLEMSIEHRNTSKAKIFRQRVLDNVAAARKRLKDA